MSDQSESSPFQALFQSALHDYEKQTGIRLANHPLAGQLQNCQSLESVTNLLQEQARAFNEFREGDKIMKSLKCLVSALSKVSATASLGHDIGMVCSGLLIECSTSRRRLNSHSHLRMQYILASVFYLLYVLLSFLHAYLVTSECLRRSRASAPTWMPS
jgi:hypothetical protein